MLTHAVVFEARKERLVRQRDASTLGSSTPNWQLILPDVLPSSQKPALMAFIELV